MENVFLENWEWFLLGLYVVEKAVRLSPTKKDDIILDMIILPVVNKIKGVFGSKTLKVFLPFIFVFMFMSSLSYAAQVRVTWNPNTEPDLAGYRLYVGEASGQYGEPIDIENVTEHVMEITRSTGAPTISP